MLLARVLLRASLASSEAAALVSLSAVQGGSAAFATAVAKPKPPAKSTNGQIQQEKPKPRVGSAYHQFRRENFAALKSKATSHDEALKKLSSMYQQLSAEEKTALVKKASLATALKTAVKAKATAVKTAAEAKATARKLAAKAKAKARKLAAEAKAAKLKAKAAKEKAAKEKAAQEKAAKEKAAKEKAAKEKAALKAAPKPRVMSGYAKFVKVNYAKAKSETSSHIEAMKKLASLYQSLSNDEKAALKKQAALEQPQEPKRSKKASPRKISALNVFLKEAATKNSTKLFGPDWLMKTRQEWQSMSPVDKQKYVDLATKLNPPKSTRPVSAMSLFVKDYAQRHKGVKYARGEFLTGALKAWKELPQVEKQKYQDLHSKQKDEYAKTKSEGIMGAK